MKKIDLSFLKHKELPTKEVKVEVNGEQVEVTIKPINGRGLTSLSLISDNDLDKSSKLCLLALMYGLDIDQDQAELFMNQDIIGADSLAAEILSFTEEYQKTLNEAREQVKKNLPVKTQKKQK